MLVGAPLVGVMLVDATTQHRALHTLSVCAPFFGEVVVFSSPAASVGGENFFIASAILVDLCGGGGRGVGWVWGGCEGALSAHGHCTINCTDLVLITKCTLPSVARVQ